MLYRYDTPYKPGSVGRPLPNLEVKVVDPETGKLAGVGKEGELWFKGPNVALGYINNPEATKGSFDSEGFYHTGDLVECGEFLGSVKCQGRAWKVDSSLKANVQPLLCLARRIRTILDQGSTEGAYQVQRVSIFTEKRHDNS